MERKVAWEKYGKADFEQLEELAREYRVFLSACKTERECAAFALQHAQDCGYKPLDKAVAKGKTLRPGDKVWAQAQGKSLVLVHLGTEPLVDGFNILGAHIDSPRLDLKQNPLFEANGFALLDTHYYGGIKNYQWVALPLAMHGVVAKKDGTVVDIVIGENADDPVFCVTDLLPHLAAKQMQKKATEVIAAEDLDIIAGNKPLVIPAKEDADAVGEKSDAKDKEKEPVKKLLLDILESSYGIEEEDFLSAEIEVVPAGHARELGFDRSMIIGYGQDDRVCAYTSLMAQLAVEKPKKTSICILVDKEEIGSVGATGMTSQFFENTIAEIMELAGVRGSLLLRRALASSSMLSSDVSAGFDPSYASAFEAKNAAYLGRGLVFNKYTGSRGKSGSNDASAEYVARIRQIMDGANVAFQTAELGRVDEGGGGTIAYIPAKYGMDVIDSGVAILSMHSPWEVSSKADIFEAYKGYQAFLKEA